MKKNFKIIVVVALFAAFMLLFSACQSNTGSAAGTPGTTQGAATPQNAEVTKYNQTLKEGKPMMVDFYSPSCGACTQLAPTLKELEKAWGSKVVFVWLNTSDKETLQIVSQKGIRLLPTLHFYGKDGKLSKELIGVQPKETIEAELKKISE